MIVFAIESSCDETAAAVVRDQSEVLSSVVSSQIDTHKKFGGVVPEVASRLHVENISEVISQAIDQSGLGWDDIDLISVTQGPGLIGCLHVGVQAAKTLAMLYDKPLVGVNHLAGHIYANKLDTTLKFPLLALLVSGGNSELIYMKDETSFEILAKQWTMPSARHMTKLPAFWILAILAVRKSISSPEPASRSTACPVQKRQANMISPSPV